MSHSPSSRKTRAVFGKDQGVVVVNIKRFDSFQSNVLVEIELRCFQSASSGPLFNEAMMDKIADNITSALAWIKEERTR